MNKSDVVDRVADAAQVGRQQAESVLNAFFETVRSAVKSGERVGWPSFGSFSLTQRKARTGRNPRTGEAVKIPASKAIKFSSGSALKDFLNTGRAARKGASKASPAKKSAPAKTAKTAKKAAPASASAGKATKAVKAAKKR